MNVLHKYKVVIVFAFIICTMAVIICSSYEKKPSGAGKIEKEGDIKLMPSQRASEDELVIGVSGATGVPYLPAADGDEIACGLIYESLLTFDTDGKILFAIADKFEINETGDIYTFHIDSNRKFSDGKSVTPQDVKLSYELYSDSSVESKYNAALSYIKGYSDFRTGSSDEIKGITAGDDFVQFHFSRSNWKNIELMSIPVTNASVFEYEKGSAKHIVNEKKFEFLGSGAFTLSGIGVDGIELSRTNAQEGGFARVVISPVGTSSVTSLFKNGLVDMYVFEADAKILEEIEEIPFAALYSFSSSTAPYVGINCRNGALGDAEVRKGLALAIQGQAEKAKSQLGKLDSDITIITYNADSFTVECDNIAEMLEKAGVKCTVVPLGLSELRERINNRDFDLYFTKAEVGKHGSVYFENNEIEGLDDENIETLKKAIEIEADYIKYKSLYQDLVKAYEDKVPRIPLENIKKYILHSPRLKNINPNPYTNAFWKLEHYMKNDKS